MVLEQCKTALGPEVAGLLQVEEEQENVLSGPETSEYEEVNLLK